jgi:hypothetical protein
MNVKAILAGGPVAIATVGGGVMWAQHELHYLLRPSVIETLAGVATVGGGVLWAMGKGKRKAAQAQPETPAVAPVQEPQALPQGQPTAAEAQAYLQGVREALLTKQAEPAPQRQVIDLGRAN